jgi:hypothetical protein
LYVGKEITMPNNHARQRGPGTMPRESNVGRLAFRVEGTMWRCYWCPRQDSMTDSIKIGSILLRLVLDNDACMQDFIALMQRAFEKQVKALIDQKPVWGEPRPASEQHADNH